MAQSSKGTQFIAARIGGDALAMADLLEQLAARDARIARLEAVLTPAQRGRLHKEAATSPTRPGDEE